jgi:hypothetical protein
VKRGEIRWYTFRLPDKRRPVLILTRDDVIDRLNEIIVVPATRTIRGLTTEVILTADDGMPVACALNFDSRVAGATESNWSSGQGKPQRKSLIQGCLIAAGRTGVRPCTLKRGTYS